MMLALAFCNTLHRTLTHLLTVRDTPDELGSRRVRCLEIDGLEKETIMSPLPGSRIFNVCEMRIVITELQSWAEDERCKKLFNATCK